MTQETLFTESTDSTGRFGAPFLSADAGPLILCLHGFPDDPWSFGAQADRLVEAGYRVVAPWLCGYHPATLAADKQYDVIRAADQAQLLLDAITDQPAVLIGHDWGAAVANQLAIRIPERIRGIVTLAVPHGPGLMDALLHNPDQQRRSWYLFFFQTALAEAAMQQDVRGFIERLWRDWSPGWVFSDDALDRVVKTLTAPGVLQAALGYYRSALSAEPPKALPKISRPALYLHGADDGCIGPECCEGMEACYAGPFEHHLLQGAGHFLHRELPDQVNTIILDWLNRL